MRKIVFTEEFCTPGNLFPFTLTRQIQDIRVGILTIREKWEHSLGLPSFDKFEEDYKDLERSVHIPDIVGDDLVYLVHGNVIPTKKIIKQVKKLKAGEFLSVPEKESVVYCISKKEVLDENRIRVGQPVEVEEVVKEINYPWNIFGLNAWAITQDYELLTDGRKSQKISGTNNVNNPSNVFIEKGAVVECSFLNAQDGPIYIGKNTQVMEGSMLRGPVAVCDGAVVKMGAKIYGGTTIGPKSVVAGEIKNSVIFGYSNKAHDGYMGDSVIGEWCNWGAGTTNSNMKNNASGVVVWTPGGQVNVGLKCGVLMGDYCRTAINTSINTGTVIGACAHVYGTGLTPKYIPSFSWGSDGLQRYEFEKALTDINNWKVLKGTALTSAEKTILKHIFDHY
ncbi:MAG TPA: putative sugar nucleotidyl transferase [Flavisolibacter sp.]|jgi:UDP-N-acetylglucosamine diphosphorylase/glucosamine-1-phosphate N-acetyltransferase|nr:putative sugar nucleotidyl transferase [Flavisolibacter sp.]